MSRLAEFRQLEKHLAKQLAALEAMKDDEGLQKEVEFETKLRELLEKYGYSLRNIIVLLDPQATHRAPAASKAVRKVREVKVYQHPTSGERVKTKGGNHRVLKAWKDEFGVDVVESWRTQ
jgi:hypothetical protein